MTDDMNLNEARKLPAALLELVASMASGDNARKQAARDAVTAIINS